jgi:Ca2+-binding EF-hand superfamily protein
MKENFALNDKNSDGELDLQEMTSLIHYLEEQGLKDTSAKLVAIADDNHDGKLALSEIIAHVKGPFFFYCCQLLLCQ